MGDFTDALREGIGWDHRRGDVIMVALNGAAGCEKRGTRPAVVLEANELESRDGHSIIAPMTTRGGDGPNGIESKRPDEVVVPAGEGDLERTSVVECQHIREVSLDERLVRNMGWLEDERMAEISEAARFALGL
jgi:mRNA-degrading endonuclease toxin of MazEF toxin-antitoxin module